MRISRVPVPATVALLCALAAACAPLWPPGAAPRGASRFNGTWTMLEGPYAGELKLWALDEQTVRVEFAGRYVYGTAAGSMTDRGEGTATARVQGDTASFTPRETEGDCAVTLRLRGQGWMRAEQAGTCDFGSRVTARGTYRKISHDRPWFGIPEPPE